MKNAVLLLLLLAATLAVRAWNWRDVFVASQVFYADADCYARMTRVRMIEKNPWQVIRHHDFENAPEGIPPHTTMPLDWLIAIVDCGVRNADLAGAWISPLLGVATAAVLFALGVGRRNSSPITKPSTFPTFGLLLFGISPILVHATALGRPDHQSLLMLLLAIALGGELANRWPVARGIAWGLALWVSLYEPLVLLGVVLAVRFIAAILGEAKRSEMESNDPAEVANAGIGGGIPRLRFASLGMTAILPYAIAFAILAVALCIEGWRVQSPGGALFDRWKMTIGELRHVSFLQPTLWRWMGWGWPLVFLPLFLKWRANAMALALLIVTLAFTLWQARWGGYLALVVCLALVTMPMPPVRGLWKAAAYALFLVSLWPVAREWDRRLDDESRRLRAAENLALRLAAAAIPSTNPQSSTLLAAWWQSPALVYWSGVPAVAGSSHESLPGIEDSARFFLTADFNEAREIARRRNAGWVICGDAENLIENSAGLLGVVPPEMPLARVLWERPHSAPEWLQLVHSNSLLRVYGVVQ